MTKSTYCMKQNLNLNIFVEILPPPSFGLAKKTYLLLFVFLCQQDT